MYPVGREMPFGYLSNNPSAFGLAKLLPQNNYVKLMKE